jgi:hypothetical protein
VLRYVPVDPSESHLGTQSGAKSILLGQQVRLEDGANDQHRRHLNHAVPDARHTPSELHSDPIDLWDLLKLSTRSTLCADSSSLF